MAIVSIVTAAALLLIALVVWHSRASAYRCRACGHQFEASALRDFLSPQGIGRSGGWKLLKCPSCGRWTRTAVIRKPREGARR